MSKKSSASFVDRILSPGGIISVLIILILASVGAYLFSRKATVMKKVSQKMVNVKPTVTPTPRPIPHGKIPFRISSSAKSGPKLAEGFVNPYDPVKGGPQVVHVSASNTEPITEVTATLKTDTASQTITLKLISGTNTDGQWEGSWTVNDTYFYTYELTLKAISSNGSKSNTLTLR